MPAGCYNMDTYRNSDLKRMSREYSSLLSYHSYKHHLELRQLLGLLRQQHHSLLLLHCLGLQLLQLMLILERTQTVYMFLSFMC